jgi:hypothetical protein
MQGNRKNRSILPEDILSAIPVMSVPVHDSDAFESISLHFPRKYRGVG